nr:unnamed protein product [Callosobruchus analis]
MWRTWISRSLYKGH